MAWRKDDFDNLDDEWIAYAASNSPRSGPRDWTPAPEDDSFDPRDLPIPEDAPTAYRRGAQLLFALAFVMLILAVLGFFDVLALPRLTATVVGITGFGALVAGVVLSTPDTNDDDGARL